MGAQAHAGVFALPRFVPQGEHAVGFEPELTLTNGAGLGANLKYTYGATELNNLTAIVGTGGGPRQFRVGSSFSFDFFPDLDSQPGIGVAVQGLYYRLKVNGQFEATLIPYVHKTFVNQENEVEPYLSVPFGMGFASGTYKMISNFVIGAIFKNSERLRYVTEVGVAINNAETYVSGGVIFYP